MRCMMRGIRLAGLVIVGLLVGVTISAAARNKSAQNAAVEILGKGVMGVEVYINGEKRGIIDQRIGEFARFAAAVVPGKSLVELKRNGNVVLSREITVARGSEYCLEVSVAGAERNAGESLSSINWIANLEHGLAVARQTNKPLMVDFYTTWCPWCTRLDKEVFTDRSVIRASQKFVCVKLNADAHAAEAQRYNVRGYPTVILLAPNGMEIDRLSFRAPEQFCAVMMRAASKVPGARSAKNRIVRDDPGTASGAVQAATPAAFKDRLLALKERLGDLVQSWTRRVKAYCSVWMNDFLRKHSS